MTWSWLLFIIIILFVFLIGIYDLIQKDHSILRNYPVIGHIRYFAENLGVYLRSYFYSSDREEQPFNRVQRSWVYSAAKNVNTTIGFGSTRNLKPIGTIFFVDAPYAVMRKDSVETKAITIGASTPNPYTSTSFFNISAMSYGSLSKNAVLALSHGAKKSDCWMDTGEGGLTSYHLSGGCDIIAEIGTAKFGYRNEDGSLSEEKLKEAASHAQVKMFEIKLSQGAKPGKGGLLPAIKVTPEIAKIRGIKPYTKCESPNRFPEISNNEELLDFINRIRNITKKPTGVKFVVGNYTWIEELFQLIHKRGIDSAPNFITIDGAEGGTGAAPLSLADYVGLPIIESLPTVVDLLIEYGLRDHIKVIAAGKLVNPGMVAWALAVGADFVNSARGFLLSLGCIQALRCNTNHCPTGITTHIPWLERGLDPTSKAERVANYAKKIKYEVGMICHSCGIKEPRELNRKHVRLMTELGRSVSLEEIYPNKIFGSKINTHLTN